MPETRKAVVEATACLFKAFVSSEVNGVFVSLFPCADISTVRYPLDARAGSKRVVWGQEGIKGASCSATLPRFHSRL